MDYIRILHRLQDLKKREKQMRDFDDEYRIHFADPGGKSALRAAGKGNPRNRPCPNCREKNRLTPADVRLGYQCDECADKAERGYD
jgi:hypothetical protein